MMLAPISGSIFLAQLLKVMNALGWSSVGIVRLPDFHLPTERRRGEGFAEHGDMAGYAAAFAEAGVDAVFSDFPALARQGTAEK